MDNGLILRPSYWASVSGGKDSLYMLNYILHNLNRYPLDGVVHFELEIDYPFVRNVIDYMERECKRVGIRFVRIKPRTSWYELYAKYGFPTRKARWCNNQYKLDSLKQLSEFLRRQGAKPVCYIGYCFDEVKRYEKRDNKNEIYPLVEAQIVEADIWEWAKTVPIFNDYYKFNRRCGCMYCPLASMSEMAYQLKYYPDGYEKFIMLATQTEIMRSEALGRPFSVFSSDPKYNAAYRDKRIREKYLPLLEKQIKESVR